MGVDYYVSFNWTLTTSHSPLCETNTLRWRVFCGYVLTGRSARPTTSGGDIFRCTFLPAAFGGQRPPVAPSFAARFLPTSLLNQRPPVAGTSSRFTLHDSLFTQLTPFGDSIFRCTAKDRGERRAKGIAIPLNPLGLMLTGNRTCFVPTCSQRCI